MAFFVTFNGTFFCFIPVYCYLWCREAASISIGRLIKLVLSTETPLRFLMAGRTSKESPLAQRITKGTGTQILSYGVSPIHIDAASSPRKKQSDSPYWFESFSFYCKGNEKLTVVPLSISLSTQIDPPCLSTNSLQSIKPRPVPISLAVPTVEWVEIK